MKILELIFNLEEAHHRFGDIDVIIDYHACSTCTKDCSNVEIKELIIEADQFIIKCE